MNQSHCDVWEIRGLLTIIRILGERAEAGVPYTDHTVACLAGYVAQLRKLLELMAANQGADTDPMSDIDRMDRWFVTGFGNLLEYMAIRLVEGPPMSECYRAQLILMMQRCHVTINTTRDPKTKETSDESSTA